MSDKLRFSADRLQEKVTKYNQDQGLLRDREERTLRPTADQMQRISARIPTVSQDIRPGEDFSQDAAYRRALEKVKNYTYTEYDNFFKDRPDEARLAGQSSIGQALETQRTDAPIVQPLSPRAMMARQRFRRANALRMIVGGAPQTLEKFPQLVNAIAEVPDFDEKDATRLINMLELDAAFDAYTSTDDPVAHDNIIATMNPVQQAAFGEYFVEKAQELLNQAIESENAEKIWTIGDAWVEGAGNLLNNTFEFLIWMNEQAQQVLRSTMYSLEQNGPKAVLLGPALPITSAIQYWDQVAPGSYDEEAIDRLRNEYGSERVDAALRYHELVRDGEPDPGGRFISEAYGTPMQEFARTITDLQAANDENLKIIELVNAAHNGNTGMLALSGLPESWRGNKFYDEAANAINVVATVGVDPTIFGAKAYNSYRAARYGLMLMSGPGGVDDAFRLARTRNFYNALGSDLDNLSQMGASAKATAKDVIESQYGKSLPPEIIWNMAASGVKNADDAHRWFTSKMIAESIIEGGTSESFRLGSKFIATYAFDEQGRWVRLIGPPTEPMRLPAKINSERVFEQILRTTNASKRNPLMPGKSVAGVYRAKARMAIALGNPMQMRFNKNIQKRFAEAISTTAQGTQQVDPETAARIIGDDLAQYGREQGVRPRMGGRRGFADEDEALLFDSPLFGYTYADKSMSARLDRLQRRFAKAPFPEEVYLNDGRHSRRIYDYARSFLTRTDAAFLADVWRTAPNQATRKQIISNLAALHASARGISFKNGKDALFDYLPEASRGGVYSSAVQMSRREDGTFALGPGAKKEELVDSAGREVTEDGTVRMRPSSFNGQEYALHLHQTSDWVMMPNFADIEAAGVKTGIVSAVLGVANGKISQGMVDTWSILNLAGPRYFMRNAIEDFGVYAMSAGNFTNIYKGRRFATAFRDARGRQLGIVNRMLRSKNKEVNIGDPNVFAQWSLIKAHFTDQDRVAAMVAMKAGDVSKMRDLVALAMARSKLTGWTNAQKEDLLDFVTEHGSKLLDEAAEVSRYGVSALYPTIGIGKFNPKTFEGKVGQEQYLKLNPPKRAWGDVSPAEDAGALTAWQGALTAISETDGIIGKIAIANLDKPDDQIVSLIAKAIRDDVQYDYKGKLSAIGATSPEEFARHYLADVRNTFSKADGSLNRDLWQKFFRVDKPLDETADGMRIVSGVTGDGWSRKPVVDHIALGKYAAEERPEYLLGLKNTIPDITDPKAFDRLWSTMGEQYARVSREPIFIANYLEQRKLLRPYEKALVETFGEKAARWKASKIATDRAYSLTMSYTDNPRNRTLLAWNTRNVARYYRATEDFMRRMLRVGKNYPEGFWKIALGYDVLEDTGFVYTDDFGEKYFLYPGSDLAIDAVHRTINLLSGDENRSVSERFSDFATGEGGLQMDGVSYGLRANVKMLTPSTDLPNSLLFNFSSPVSGIGFKTLFNIVPELQRFERLVLGEYQEGKDWLGVLPGHALRAFSLRDRDERNSAYASSFKDAVQVAAAAGAMPDYGASQSEKNAYRRDLSNLVVSMMILRTLTGVFAPTTGQITANNVTDIARRAGLLDLDKTFQAFVRQADPESLNPYGDAAIKFVETYGLERSFFTISTSQSTDSADSAVEGLSTVSASKEGAQWVQDNSDLVARHKTAAAWLLPRRGEFDFKFHKFLQSVGYRSPKPYNDVLDQAYLIEGQYVLYGEMEYANDFIDQAKMEYYNFIKSGNTEAAEAKWEEVRELENRKTAASDAIKADYPQLRYSEYTINKPREELLNKEIRPMLDYIYEQRNKEVEPVIDLLSKSVSTFDLYISKLGMIEGTTRAANEMKRNLKIELEILLDEIGESDERISFFNRRVLVPLLNEGYLFPAEDNNERSQ